MFEIKKRSHDLLQPIVIDSLPENIIRNSLVKAMAESPTGLSEMEFMDCDDLNYEMDFDVDILDGFHLENTLYHVNDKVQQFAFYWMKLYSNCCIQRDEALGLLRLGNVDDAIRKLEDWPETIGCPDVPQVLPTEQDKQLKHKKARKATDVEAIIQEMRSKFVPSNLEFHHDVPNEFPTEELTLDEYEIKIKECDRCFQTVENYHLKNAFVYGKWIEKAFQKFQEDKRNKFTSVTNFDEWVNRKCCVKKTRARQLRMFYNRFNKYIKVLQCKLPFIWFVYNGPAILNYFKDNEEEAVQWV